MDDDATDAAWHQAQLEEDQWERHVRLTKEFRQWQIAEGLIQASRDVPTTSTGGIQNDNRI